MTEEKKRVREHCTFRRLQGKISDFLQRLLRGLFQEGNTAESTAKVPLYHTHSMRNKQEELETVVQLENYDLIAYHRNIVR